MNDVLVLNRSFFAVNVTSWQRAVTLVYIDHAYVVDDEYKTYDFADWCSLSEMMRESPAGFVHTPSFRMAVPQIIALRYYDKLPKNEVKFTRRNIYEHYGYKCCYCGHKFSSSELNLDHIVPKSRGGQTDWHNIVTSCVPCNLKKDNRLPVEAGMKLLIMPTRPKWKTRLSLVVKAPYSVKGSWQRFIDTVYWNVELE